MRQSLLFGSKTAERLLIPGADVVIMRGWLDDVPAQILFDHCLSELQWQQPRLVIAGKSRRIPRLQAWHGDQDARYTYSGRLFTPSAWTEQLFCLRVKLQQGLGSDFNSVLANCYRDGNDSVSYHADDEPELGRQPVIASLSLGCARRFLLKPKPGVGPSTGTIKVDLQAGDLMVMSGDTQRHWLHSVPKTTSAASPRVNLTFRHITPR